MLHLTHTSLSHTQFRVSIKFHKKIFVLEIKVHIHNTHKNEMKNKTMKNHPRLMHARGDTHYINCRPTTPLIFMIYEIMSLLWCYCVYQTYKSTYLYTVYDMCVRMEQGYRFS